VKHSSFSQDLIALLGLASAQAALEIKIEEVEVSFGTDVLEAIS